LIALNTAAVTRRCDDRLHGASQAELFARGSEQEREEDHARDVGELSRDDVGVRSLEHVIVDDE